MTPRDPLRIQAVLGVDLLDTKIVLSGKDAIAFECGHPPVAMITFDYLDKKDGAVIQVIHNGLSIDDVTLLGTIKGAREPLRVLSIAPQETTGRRAVWVLVFLALLGVIAWVVHTIPYLWFRIFAVGTSVLMYRLLLGGRKVPRELALAFSSKTKPKGKVAQVSTKGPSNGGNE